MKYFTGIDVSLRSVSICVVDEAGEVQYEAKVAAEIDVIVATLRRFSVEIRQVGFEAGALTQYLTYGLSQAGFEVICMEARQVAASLAAMRNKTDRNDARGLAQILRTGWYRTVHVKSLESHQVRALLSSRKMILTKCIDLENELRGLLKVFGVRLPPRVGHGGFDELVRPKVLALPELVQVPAATARCPQHAVPHLPATGQRRPRHGAPGLGLPAIDDGARRRSGHLADVQDGGG